MTKPFNVRELQTRVRSQLRKVHVLQAANNPHVEEDDASLVIGALKINQKNHQVIFQENQLELTATEFELLHHLASHPNQVFSRS